MTTIQYFTSERIYAYISEVQQILATGERVSDFIAMLFGTKNGGFIEWYDFLDFLLVMKNIQRPLSRKRVARDMKTARKEGIKRPWSFDVNGVCSTPGALVAARKAFKSLDMNRDGVIDKKEVKYAFPGRTKFFPIV